MAPEASDNHTSSRQPAGPPPHFRDRYVLDPLFQNLVARGIRPGKAKRLILEFLQDGRILLSEHIVGGVWSLRLRDFATEEEAMRVAEEARALRNRFAFIAAEELFYEQSPPGGCINPINPEAWGHSITVTVDNNRRLVIADLIPEFPPESYSFAIANSEAVDGLVDEAAASSAHASSAAVGPNPSIPEPPRPAPRAGKGDHVKWALQALKIADPNFLVGLSEKELCEHVCRKISANFSCAPKTVQRALDDLGWR